MSLRPRVVVLAVGVLCIGGLLVLFLIRPSFFTLSHTQVRSLVGTLRTPCTVLAQCPLQEGDIVVRRLLTDQTWPLYILGSYFTHSALVAPQGMLVEAIGNNPDSTREIEIHEFASSDWVMSEADEEWVVIRPRLSIQQVAGVVGYATAIAHDPQYRFGLAQLSPHAKVTSCAELIFDSLQSVPRFVDNAQKPSLVTPDYLFWFALTHPEYFELIAVSPRLTNAGAF